MRRTTRVYQERKNSFICLWWQQTCYFVLISVITALLSGCTRVSESSQNDEKILISLEEQWLQFEFDGDTSNLSSLLHSDYISITPDKNIGKEELLKQVLRNFQFRIDNNIRIDSFKFVRPQVTFHKDVALVTFVEHFFASKDGVKVEGNELFYDVWIRENGRWQAVSSQKHY